MGLSAQAKKYLEAVAQFPSRNRDDFSEMGQFAALAREMVKDVRGTLHQVFFNQPEHTSEIGTPLNPTQALTTASITGKELYGRGNDVSPGKDQRSLEMDMG